MLEEKGHVRHEEHGLRYVYVPTVPRDAAWHSAALGNAVGVWGPAHAIASGPSSLTLPSMIVDAGAVSPLFGKLAGLALLVWAAGFLFFAMRLIVGLARLVWISARAKPLF